MEIKLTSNKKALAAMDEKKKQILYPSIVSRLSGASIDLVVLSIVFIPISLFLKYYYSYILKDFLISQGISLDDDTAIGMLFSTKVFWGYISLHKDKLFLIFVPSIMLNILLAGVYFVGFWVKFSTTPGKFLFGQRIVSTNTSSLSTWQATKRFIGYFTIIIGIWPAMFNRQGLAMHDKIAKTVVIRH